MSNREGYLIIDHSASPGIPEEAARWAGYDPKLCGEGKVFEAASLRCAHCGGCVIKNPLRQRERASCTKCGNLYICDGCEAQSRLPGYVHTPFERLADIVRNGAEHGIVITNPSKVLFPT